MHVDLTVILRSVITVLWFLAFVGLCLWAWSGRRRHDFAAAARLPFDDVTDDISRKDEISRRDGVSRKEGSP